MGGDEREKLACRDFFNCIALEGALWHLGFGELAALPGRGEVEYIMCCLCSLLYRFAVKNGWR